MGEYKMITIFNRKELLVTFDIKRQNDVRDILSANGIDYVVKVNGGQNSMALGASRARDGSFSMNSNLAYEYKIYVHKKDYDYSASIIG
jgi:hypothetical protein